MPKKKTGRPTRDKEQLQKAQFLNAMLEAIGSALGGSEITLADVDIERSGTKLILPDDPPISTGEAIALLHKLEEEEETEVLTSVRIEAHPMDGAIAATSALVEVFGGAQAKGRPAGWSWEPPQVLDVKTGPLPGDTTKVPWGRFKVEQIEGTVDFRYDDQKGGQRFFALTVYAKKKYQRLVDRFVAMVRELAATDSIYRGKALRWDGEREPHEQFRFWPLAGESELILNKVTDLELEMGLFTPLLYPQQALAAGIPGKRAALLEGPYGTGKTLTALHVARRLEGSDWTFLYCEQATQLADAMRLARLYEPALVFCEDADQIMADREGPLANILDGIDTKASKVFLVLTTNHVERIHPVYLRAGRLDSIVTYELPNPETVARLVRAFAGDLLVATDAEVEEASEVLAGQIPAVVAEVVQRAKLLSIGSSEGKDAQVLGGGLLAASKSMVRQIERVKPAEPEVPDPLSVALSKTVHAALRDPNGGPASALDLLASTSATVEKIAEYHGVDE